MLLLSESEFLESFDFEEVIITVVGSLTQMLLVSDAIMRLSCSGTVDKLFSLIVRLEFKLPSD